MNTVEILDRIAPPSGEYQFLTQIESRSDPRLIRWAGDYHYFSLHQAHHLALVVRKLNPLDADSLVEVTRALFEEYGSGASDAVHSVLFARFAVAAGVPADSLPKSRSNVNLAVLEYIDCIEQAYQSNEIGIVMGAYAYLERSAVLSYPLMLECFKRLGFNADELAFFTTHVIQEAGHDQAAQVMTQRFIKNSNDFDYFERQVNLMHQRWSAFWDVFR